MFYIVDLSTGDVLVDNLSADEVQEHLENQYYEQGKGIGQMFVQAAPPSGYAGSDTYGIPAAWWWGL